jgi:hypothetical protein
MMSQKSPAISGTRVSRLRAPEVRYFTLKFLVPADLLSTKISTW